MFDFSPIQIIIVLAIVLIVFGPKRLPDLGRSLGSSIRGFRGSLEGREDESPKAERTDGGADAEPSGLELIQAQGEPEPVTLDGDVEVEAEPVTAGRTA